MTSTEQQVFQLAMQAVVEPVALPVLGDAVLELGWFDPRVMMTMFGRPRNVPHGGHRTAKARDKGRAARAEHARGYPEFFHAHASKPVLAWARAIIAVFLFGSWSTTKRGWRVVGSKDRAARVREQMRREAFNKQLEAQLGRTPRTSQEIEAAYQAFEESEQTNA